ncbi:MAG: aldehyde dehydrogenase family protein [Geminicoccaceae bacterium]
MQIPLMIPSAKHPGLAPLSVEAPFEGAPIGEVAVADAATVETALGTADRLFRNRDGWLPAYQRIEILERALAAMTEQADSLALEAAREGGKPLIDSRIEVARAIDSFKICIETLRTEAGPMIPMGVTPSSANRLAMTRLEPIGPVVAVSAFNHPLNLIAHQIGPTIASGCPVIVKPADDTPLSCFRLVQILREAGLPEDWCQPLVTDTRETAEKLVTDSRVAFFSFIGSPKVGWMLRSKLAPGARCALEHGGAAPVIVTDNVDLDDVVPPLLKGGFYHAGQVCVSVQRVFAHEAIADELIERLAAGASALKVGDPTDGATEVGPLIRSAEANRVESWVDEAGVDPVTGGKRLSDTLYAPTVLVDPSPDALVSTKEIFGPVVIVYRYSDFDQAIARANALPFAFQAAIFTNDLNMATRAAGQLDASAVMINDHTAFRVDWMPFAGLKQSGLGVGGIPHSMHDMRTQKMIVIHSKQL